MVFQMFVVYGLTSSQKGAPAFNQDLIDEVLQSSEQLDIPTVILGDFNSNPMESNADALQARGYQDLKQKCQAM